VGLTQRTIDLAAKAFGVAASEVLGEEHRGSGRIPPSRRNESSTTQVKVEGYRPPPDIFGARDLKVFAAVEAGPGTMVVSTEPIELVPRPWYLREVKDGFAVLVVGDSMEPVYEAGDLVIVNPRLPPMRGKDVILVSGEHEGEFTASIKRLVSWTATHWHLKQFNPPAGQKATFTWSKADWPRALRVVGRYSGS
jgi:phage repressor protein C with HTH and peptisase S24 domain